MVYYDIPHIAFKKKKYSECHYAFAPFYARYTVSEVVYFNFKSLYAPLNFVCVPSPNLKLCNLYFSLLRLY